MRLRPPRYIHILFLVVCVLILYGVFMRQEEGFQAEPSTNLFVISGNARTIMSCIDNCYAHLITRLFSNEPGARVSVYMHLKLTDPCAVIANDTEHAYAPVDREAMLEKIEELSNAYPEIKLHHTLLGAEEITESELFSQVNDRSRFTGLLADDKFLLRSMFIHYNYERCGANIRRLEKENGRSYDTYVYVRPDVLLTEDCATIDTYPRDKITISSKNKNPDNPDLSSTGLIYIIPKTLFSNFFVDIMNVYRTNTGYEGRLDSAEYVAASAFPYQVANISNPIILRN